jgi:glycolate oxidase
MTVTASALIPDLHRGLGNRLVTDQATLAGYRHDEARNVPHGVPAAVVLAKSASDVQEVLRAAGRHAAAVVCRGAGSGLSGGANAVDGGIVLSLERMDSLLDLDPRNLYAVVQPGMINAQLSTAAREFGLYYPPDPASREISTLGGNVATNAGGLCCVKYGVTRDSVLGLEVVLADGTIVQTGRRTLKGVAGYDLTGLFVGSEGTLGVVTSITLRLRPLPPPPSTLIAFFPSLVSLGEAVVAIRGSLVPSLLELIDQATIRAVEAWRPLDLNTDAAGVLIAQSDAGEGQGTREVALMESLCIRAGAEFTATTDDPQEAEVFLAARKLAHASVKRLGNTLLDDVSVPCSRIPDLLRALVEISAREGLLIATVGHAGDGNLHPMIVFDDGNADQVAAARRAFDTILTTTIGMGGTISGEHGVGLLKRDYMERAVGSPSLVLQQSIKRLLDPAGILNPGKVLPA